MVELKTAAQIEQMRAAGRVVAAALTAVKKEAAVGVSLRELDEVARDVLRSAGAVSLFDGYQPGFATSPVQRRDLYVGERRRTARAAERSPARRRRPAERRLRRLDRRLVRRLRDQLRRRYAARRGPGTDRDHRRGARRGDRGRGPGARLGDIGAAIGEVGHRAGVGTNLDFGGHGIGRRMHEEPHIPNGGHPGRGLKLRPGHVIAIEPWFWHGPGSVYVIDEDGWTLRSADRTRGAHAEHTVAITDPKAPRSSP